MVIVSIPFCGQHRRRVGATIITTARLLFLDVGKRVDSRACLNGQKRHDYGEVTGSLIGSTYSSLWRETNRDHFAAQFWKGNGQKRVHP